MTSQSPLPKYQGGGVFTPLTNIHEYIHKLIVERGPITRNELSRLTGIPRTTIYDTVYRLILAKQVQKLKGRSRRRGRPHIFYEALPPESP
jgi:predicted transcriptional regulator